MNHLRASVLCLALVSLAACASPPYSRQDAARDVAMADYQDCYSRGALEHYTPESKASVNKSTRACMKARGYSETGNFPWW